MTRAEDFPSEALPIWRSMMFVPAHVEKFVARAHQRGAAPFGSVGAFCVHPSQVAVTNEEFSPLADEVRHAQGVIAAYDAARREGRGAAVYDGKMIETPVVARAQELLRRVPTATTSRQEKT